MAVLEMSEEIKVKTIKGKKVFVYRNWPQAHAVGFWDYQAFIVASNGYQHLGFRTTGGNLMSMLELFLVMLVLKLLRFNMVIHTTLDELDILSCDICRNVTRRPIYSCFYQHKICAECHNRVGGLCPYCRGGELRESRAINGILSQAMVSCLFKDRGCLQILPIDEYPRHINQCPFAKLVCPICSIGITDDMMLKSHFQRHPCINMYYLQEFELNLTQGTHLLIEGTHQRYYLMVYSDSYIRIHHLEGMQPCFNP
ncbi:uncharacterized protein LOC141588376 [Silene latifolia]|uniref:uncharacterized protein LOC141588376 n=1 Tax=Silene latifolia TaxID=37657 RepID=UPI003D771903